jgi:hypothetical protein
MDLTRSLTKAAQHPDMGGNNGNAQQGKDLLGICYGPLAMAAGRNLVPVYQATG